MESLSKCIDQEALEWADGQFAKLGLAGRGNRGLTAAAAPNSDILSLERHIIECMWALVVQFNRLSVTDKASSAAYKTEIYTLIELLSYSIYDRVDEEALNLADRRFSLGRAGRGGRNTSSAADIDIHGMELHVVECMWALVAKSKHSPPENLTGAATRSFYHLIKMLCKVGQKKESFSGLFLPVPKHRSGSSSDQARVDALLSLTDSVVGADEEDCLQFPPNEEEEEQEVDEEEVESQAVQLESDYDEQMDIYHYSLTQDLYAWAPIFCTVLYKPSLLSESENSLRYMEEFISKQSNDNLTPVVHDILHDSKNENGDGFLTERDALVLLKVVRLAAPWAFRMGSNDQFCRPLHRAAHLLVDLETLKFLVETYPPAVKEQSDSNGGAGVMDTPLLELVISLVRKDVDGGGLDDGDIEKLKYLISVTPQATMQCCNADGCTALHESLVYRDTTDWEIDYSKPRDLRVARILLDACPNAAMIVSGLFGKGLPFEFCSRYCSRQLPQADGDLDFDELEALHPEMIRLLRDLFTASGDYVRGNVSTLFGLQQWDCVRRLCRDPWLPVLKLVCQSFPEAVRANRRQEGTMLHTIISRSTASLREAKYVHSLFPDAISMVDLAIKMTTLHAASICEMNPPSLEKLQWIHSNYPGAIREKTVEGDLPLHYYIYYYKTVPKTTFFQTVKWLTDLYPESMAVPNIRGDTPYDAVRSIGLVDEESERFLLSTCPGLDLERFHNLNYNARRGALFLLHRLSQIPAAPLLTAPHLTAPHLTAPLLTAPLLTVSPLHVVAASKRGGGGGDSENSSSGDAVVAPRWQNVWWQVANTADMTIVKEVVSYL